jgi:hypothetical protein
MGHSSRGYLHHADSTTECPGCGRRHRTGTSVTQRPDGNIGVLFRSKQTGQWGHIVVPVEAVAWSDNHPMSAAPTSAPEPEPTVALVTQTCTDASYATRTKKHPVGECPGLMCDDAWHDNGCDPFWSYSDAAGFNITGSFYAEQDATTKTLWEGPDGPSEVWRRAKRGDEWRRDS